MFGWQRLVFGIIGLIIVLTGVWLIVGFTTLVDVEVKGEPEKVEVRVKNAPPGIVCVIIGGFVILGAMFAPGAKLEMEIKGVKQKVPIKVLRGARAFEDASGAYHVDIRDDPEIRKVLEKIEKKASE